MSVRRDAVWRRLPDIEPNYSPLVRSQRSVTSMLRSRLGAVIIQDNHKQEQQLNVLAQLQHDQARAVYDNSIS